MNVMMIQKITVRYRDVIISLVVKRCHQFQRREDIVHGRGNSEDSVA